jgi:hypothetical protein
MVLFSNKSCPNDMHITLHATITSNGTVSEKVDYSCTSVPNRPNNPAGNLSTLSAKQCPETHALNNIYAFYRFLQYEDILRTISSCAFIEISREMVASWLVSHVILGYDSFVDQPAFF